MVTCSETNVHSTECTPNAQYTIALSHMGMVAQVFMGYIDLL